MEALPEEPAMDWSVFESKLTKAESKSGWKRAGYAILVCMVMAAATLPHELVNLITAPTTVTTPVAAENVHATQPLSDLPTIEKATEADETTKSSVNSSPIPARALPANTLPPLAKSSAENQHVSGVSKNEPSLDITEGIAAAQEVGSSAEQFSGSAVETEETSVLPEAAEALPEEIPVPENAPEPTREPLANTWQMPSQVLLARIPTKHSGAALGDDYVLDMSQEIEPVIPLFQEESRWSFSLSFYPSFSFRELKVNPQANARVHKDFLNYAHQSEESGMGINLGLDIRYFLGNDLFVVGGVSLIQNKVTGTYNFVVRQEANIDPVTREISGYTSTNRPVNFGMFNTFRYLHIPAHLSYQPWASKRVRLNIEGGMSMLMFMQATGKGLHYQTLTEIDVSEHYYQNFVPSLDVKIGVNYYLSPKLSIGAEPTLMYFLNSMYATDFPLYALPYNVGVNLNLRLKLL